MRSQTISSLAAFLLTSPLLAQAPVVAFTTPSSQGCPVTLDARHAQNGALITTQNNEGSREQAYRLTFLPQDARSIVQAQVRLHGLGGPGVLPARSPGEGTATEDFTLAPSHDASRRFVSVLYAHKLTGVQWIELQSLRYADGTTWRSSASSVCRVAPDGFMLVSAAR